MTIASLLYAKRDQGQLKRHTMSWASIGSIAMNPRSYFSAENKSNAQRLWAQPNASPYVKDAFHQYIISGNSESVNPAKTGIEAAAHYVLDVPGGGSKTVRLRLATLRQKIPSAVSQNVQKPHRRR